MANNDLEPSRKVLHTIRVRAIKDFYCTRLLYDNGYSIIKCGEETELSFTCSTPGSWFINIDGCYYPFYWEVLMEYFEPISFIEGA